MKKYLILTSVLALAACGGGSHGGGSVNAPDTLNARITDAAAASNQAITAMKSQVIVSNKTSGDLSRSATETVGGVTFTSYDLSDVKLFAADADHTDNGYLKIGMDDNGRIEKITMNIGEVGAPVQRVGETNRFKGPIFEYVESGDQAAYRISNTGQTAEDLAALKAELIAQGKIHDGGHWNMVNEEMDVVTLGGDIDGNGTALQYADFGHFNPVYTSKYKNVDGLTDEQMAAARNGEDLGRGSELDKIKSTTDFDAEMAAEDYQLFAGGYAIRGTELKDSLAVPRGAEFKGKAIGRVYTSVSVDEDAFANETLAETARITQAAAARDGEGYSTDHDINKAFTTTEATLKIDVNGKQTLEMPFYTHSGDPENKFYDVKLVKNGDIVEAPVFTGTPTDPRHNLGNALDHVQEASFNPGYYGVNTASEAAGTARLYSEEDLGNHVQREYEVQAAYGMKRQ